MSEQKTKPFRPANGEHGDWFMQYHCYQCKRDEKFQKTQDGADSCPIVMKSMLHDVGDPEYPKEWICNEDGSEPKCTAFEDIKEGE